MKVVVISPHPDDETLGAGGTLLRMRAEGHEIHWVIVTHMNESFGNSQAQIDQRERQILGVGASYKFSGIHNLKYTPASLDSVKDSSLISDIGSCIAEIRPEVVILPDPNDAHSDHLEVYRSSMAVLKTFRAPYVKLIMTMEILSESNFGNAFQHFAPNLYVDITEYLDKKIDILSIFDTEIGPHPFPRSIDSVKALATLRGAEAGCRWAEAFHIIKKIV
jgi:LmbE family N-acetylglucosaminyl deacetylase